MLEAAGLKCVRGDKTLFDGLGFTLGSGQLLHIKGENGSGKTSLLRMLCGLVEPAEGEIRWQGENALKLAEDYFSQLLYIGHSPGIKADLSALENLKVTCALSGTPVSEDDAWGSLVKIGLGGREDLPTKVLSQGQKRRVALARMLLSKAPLWILDEPFTALDVKAVAELEDVIATHLDNEGMVVLTTHQAIKHLAGRETILDLSSREATA